jgi:Tetratricopeptide repeat
LPGQPDTNPLLPEFLRPKVRFKWPELDQFLLLIRNFRHSAPLPRILALKPASVYRTELPGLEAPIHNESRFFVMVYSHHSPDWGAVTQHRSAVLLLLSFIALPAPLLAQRGFVGGHVFLEDNAHPARGVTVELLNVEHSSIARTRTDDSGEFTFGGFRLAQYFVTVQVADYDAFSLGIDLNYEVSDHLIIYLKPISKGRNSVSGGNVSAHELSMPSKARKLYASGQKKLYQEQNATGAVADFEQAVVIASGYYEASYQLGMANLALNNPSQAEIAFRKSIESSSDTFGDADVRLGALLLDHSNPEAEKFIRRGVELSPNFWRAHYELGRALVSQKKLPEALAAAEKARELAPNMAPVYRLLSSIHFLQADYPAVLEDLDTYISLDPDSPNGRGAKQLRDEIRQKLAQQTAPPPQPPKP